MSRAQIIAVGLAVLLAMLDGFDVQSMAFVAPVVGKAWAIGRATLGLALASSLIGMAIGSIVLSPVADVFGRKPVVLGGLALMALGAAASGLSSGIGELALSRALTGLGIGVMVSLTNTVSAEFANARRRALCVASTATGFGLGVAGGGVLASILLRAHPWFWVFFAGAIAAAVLGPVILVALPESPSFLMERNSPGALVRLNRVLARAGRPSLASLPPWTGRPAGALRPPITAGVARLVVVFAVPFVLITVSAFYLISWLPQLIVDAGFSPATASLSVAVSSLVGLPASLLAGALGARVSPVRLASAGMVAFGVALAVLGVVPPVLAGLILAASACAFLIQGSMASIYAAMTIEFPAVARASGVGFVLGLGRLGSGIGPLAAGALFSAGWTRSGVSLLFAAVAMIAGVSLATGFRRGGRQRRP